MVGIGDLCHLFLHPVKPLCCGIYDTYLVTHDDIGEAISQKKSCDSDTGTSCAIYNDLAVFFLLADNLQCIDNTCKDNDCSTMLVIMENRNITAFL